MQINGHYHEEAKQSLKKFKGDISRGQCKHGIKYKVRASIFSSE